MKASTKVKTVGRPRSLLREWYSENLPKMRPIKSSNGNKEVTVFVPEVDGDVVVEIPKGFVAIPPELTAGKTQATVGQTARNEAKSLGLRNRNFTVHELLNEVAIGRGKNKETVEFSLFAIEPK